MKIAFIVRSTLFKVQGGDTIQVLETASHLRDLGVQVSIFLSHEKISYGQFDLLHFFNLTRPANILHHIKKTDRPFVVSPILVDYTEYDKNYRTGLSGWVLRLFASPEYIKTVARWLFLKDSLPSREYLWKGQRRSIQYILEKAAMLLPNSTAEYQALEKQYSINKPYRVVPNGINENIFLGKDNSIKDESLVVCAARIEGIKNQLNLIKALNHSSFTLMVIGTPGANQTSYYKKCRKTAGKNIIFTGRLTQKELRSYYQKAKLHILPSWFETCGLSSLEAAAMGCNIIITDKGYTREYFGDEAFYCDPGNIESIYHAVSLAAKSDPSTRLQERIRKEFTWTQAAQKTWEAYQTVLLPDKKFCYQ
jgi:glycosyltransferase involved in cell wall biosynthesis